MPHVNTSIRRFRSDLVPSERNIPKGSGCLCHHNIIILNRVHVHTILILSRIISTAHVCSVCMMCFSAADCFFGKQKILQEGSKTKYLNIQ